MSAIHPESKSSAAPKAPLGATVGVDPPKSHYFQILGPANPRDQDISPLRGVSEADTGGYCLKFLRDQPLTWVRPPQEAGLLSTPDAEAGERGRVLVEDGSEEDADEVAEEDRIRHLHHCRLQVNVSLLGFAPPPASGSSGTTAPPNSKLHKDTR